MIKEALSFDVSEQSADSSSGLETNKDTPPKKHQSTTITAINWVTNGPSQPKTQNIFNPREPYRRKTHPPANKLNYNLPSLFRRVTDVLFDADNIPDRISATYSDDYDILHVHDIVLCRLELEKKELPEMYRKKEEIEKRLKNQLKIVERKKLVGQLEEIKTKINLIESEANKKNYIEESKNLLQRYQQLGPIIKVRSFLDENKEDFIENPEQEDRLSIIRQYLDIAKKYIPLNVVRIIPNNRTCPGCGQELVFVDPEDYSLERCEECGFERQNFSKPSFFKESANQGRSVSNSDYEDRENFIKALECYLGEQKPPPESLFKALDAWAEKYNHPPKEEIRQLPLNEDGTRGEYGKSMLLQALADEGYADYYKDIKLIGHLHWGWKLPSVTQQERDLILQDYDNTQKVFNAIPKERKSSLNTQYRLYRHLEARKIPCKPTDFKLPTTPGILEEQDTYWREMVKVIPGAEFTSLK